MGARGRVVPSEPGKLGEEGRHLPVHKDDTTILYHYTTILLLRRRHPPAHEHAEGVHVLLVGIKIYFTARIIYSTTLLGGVRVFRCVWVGAGLAQGAQGVSRV